MGLRWDDVKLFVTVVEQGSLSAAARVLRLGQPTLSRRIGELEEAIGENLFERASHGVTLTQAGEKLLPAAQRMAEWAHQAEQNISQKAHLPEGKIRIAAPPGIAFDLLAPLSKRLQMLYPKLYMEVLSGVETLNLGRGEADISLRTAAPNDEDLICLDQVHVRIRVYAAPSYAAEVGKSPKPEDLNWICWAESHDHLYVNQCLRALISNFRPAFTSDDFNVQVAACRAGLGAMPLAKAPHMYSVINELTELDLDLGPDAAGSLYLVVHKRHRYLPKVQCVTEIISAAFEELRQTLNRP